MWGWLKTKPVQLAEQAHRPNPFEPAVATFAPDEPELIPESIVAIDVETTGIHSTDRVVSLGAIWLSTHCLSEPSLPISYLHLIFDPLKKSHPEAEKVHGYDDWMLRHQEPFWRYAPAIRRFLHSGSVIVAHNAEFDLGFINREMELAGESARLKRPSFCTMLEYRRRHGSPANLTAASGRIGLSREGGRHGALEDAWLALMVYLNLHGYDCIKPFSEASQELGIFNQLACPPRPEGPLPRRDNKAKRQV